LSWLPSFVNVNNVVLVLAPFYSRLFLVSSNYSPNSCSLNSLLAHALSCSLLLSCVTCPALAPCACVGCNTHRRGPHCQRH
jgi:hypothetical protein